LVNLRGGIETGEGGDGDAKGIHGECGECGECVNFGEGGLADAISAPLSALARVVICESAAEMKPVEGLLLTLSLPTIVSFGTGISIVNVGGDP
jgi:hypothetical protein